MHFSTNLALASLAVLFAAFGALDTFGFSLSQQAWGATCHCSQCAASPAARTAGASTWHAVETPNFRILNYGIEPVPAQAADSCEALRDRLIGQWLLGEAIPAWTPKCVIVLHPTDASYAREVGSAGRNTVASSLVDRKHQQIASRRVDIRSHRAGWQSLALAHELTHVVLADRFAAEALPRWVDEGLAILADPAEKQRQHFGELKSAMASGIDFRVLELLTLADYPSARRWGAFYGQSASVVQFLVGETGHRRFLEFVELSLDRGYEGALREVYGYGIAELERRWRAHVVQDRKVASAATPSEGRADVRTVSVEVPAR